VNVTLPLGFAGFAVITEIIWPRFGPLSNKYIQICGFDRATCMKNRKSNQLAKTVVNAIVSTCFLAHAIVVCTILMTR
jgi:hypothetical protein